MALRIHETTSTIHVFFSDMNQFDDKYAQDARSDLNDACGRAARANKQLLLDFRGVTVMSSQFISNLILLGREAQKRSVSVRYSNVCPMILEVFKLMRFHKLFNLNDQDPESGPDFMGSGVPNPRPPSTLDGQAWPPME